MNELLAKSLSNFTSTNNWFAIAPEIMLAVLALCLLGAEMVLPRERQRQIANIAIWGQVVVLIITLSLSRFYSAEAQHYFSGMIQQTDVTHLMRGFFLVSSILVCYLGKSYLDKHQLPKTEFFHLVIVIAAAMMLLVQSANFVMLFVTLEAVTVAFYVLVAYCRTNPLSLEAGLKYLILGAFSSSILLFGIVLLYGIAGNPTFSVSTGDALSFSELTTFISVHPDNLLVRLGAVLVVAGLCFKIAAVPFQIWVPDVYQGAPTPVTAYLAVASKAAGFIVLLQLLKGPFSGLDSFLIPLLSMIAMATILFGSITAVTQRNTKRLLGLSGIAHAGYLLVGVIASTKVPWAEYAVIFYFITYLLASFTVFGVIMQTADSDDSNQELSNFENLARKRPFLSAALTVGLGSLAGIPPLGGFIGKLLIFIAAYEAGLYGLLGVAICGVVISIYYYFGWIRVMYFSQEKVSEEEEPKIPVSVADRFVFGALVTAIVLVGLFPGVLPIIPK
ncbi:MAG: NADH-quinone oxidoreductase subunit N [Zhongshania aliphaticivorans]|jgi:NADH-quinone oxidoreductase subunit N